MMLSAVWLTRVASLCLLATVAWAGAYSAPVVWRVLSPSSIVFVEVDWSNGTVSNDNGADASVLVEEIADGQWFGEFREDAEKKPEPPPVVVETAPATRLQLVLQGVFSANSPQQGSAMISQRGRGAELFRVGDTIFGQAELVEVHRNRVVLRRAGVLETLSFDEAPLAGSGPAASAQTTSAAPTPVARPSAPARTTEETRGAVSSSGSRSDASARNVADAQERLDQQIRQAITDVRAQAFRNPQGLLNQYGLELTEQGYRVTPRSGILIANGLRPGDVITEVNDQRVGNIERDQQLIEAVLASGEIRITLERAGATFRIFQNLPSF
ncbi:PDZ domain-containing protein [Salinispirillum sp. LH 10-3-1]|uniref:PDZ domain-containing protein n=1 Tax=Salinispirillum sp. LH 10-3-1 TaxID=2952525 RepID=A0AB38YIQ0_9GAMM